MKTSNIILYGLITLALIGVVFADDITATLRIGKPNISPTTLQALQDAGYCGDKCSYVTYDVSNNYRMLNFGNGSIGCSRTRTAIFVKDAKNRNKFDHYDYQDWNDAEKLCLEKATAPRTIKQPTDMVVLR